MYEPPPYRPPPEATIARAIIIGAALIGLPVLLPMLVGAAGTGLFWFLILNKALSDAMGATSALPLLFIEVSLMGTWLVYLGHRKQIRAIGWMRFLFGRGMFKEL